MLVNLQLLVNFGLIPCSRSRDCYFNIAMGSDFTVRNIWAANRPFSQSETDLRAQHQEGGNRSAREKPSKSGWNRLKVNPHTTFVVEVDGVIDFQRVRHRKSIQTVTHPDINPVQQGLTSVNRREPVFPFGASRTRRCVRAVSFGTTNYEQRLHLPEWVSECHIWISESPQETRFYASRIHEFKNWIIG